MCRHQTWCRKKETAGESEKVADRKNTTTMPRPASKDNDFGKIISPSKSSDGPKYYAQGKTHHQQKPL